MVRLSKAAAEKEEEQVTATDDNNTEEANDDLEDDIMNEIHNGDQFYFVHSYHVCGTESSMTTYLTSYGYDFISGIRFGNSIATQFHPEKSQEKGLKLYRNFLEKMA